MVLWNFANCCWRGVHSSVEVCVLHSLKILTFSQEPSNRLALLSFEYHVLFIFTMERQNEATLMVNDVKLLMHEMLFAALCVELTIQRPSTGVQYLETQFKFVSN